MSTTFVVACAVTVAFEVGAVAFVCRTVTGAVVGGEPVPARRVSADQGLPESSAAGDAPEAGRDRGTAA